MSALRAGTLLAALLGSALVACAPGGSRTEAPPPGEEADHAIYDAILDARVFDEESVIRRYVVVDSTVGNPPQSVGFASALVVHQFVPRLGGFVAAALPDLHARNRQRFAVRTSALRSASAGPAIPPVHTTPEQRGEFWRQFHDRFPGEGGPIAFTRPGFSPGGRHALVLVVDYDGGSGRVGYVLLERGVHWTVLHAVVLARS